MSPPSFWEIAFLAVVALLVFGPERLPEMARKAGRTLAKFKAEANSTLDELKRSADLDDLRGTADELRSTGRELKAMSALTGPMASADRPTTSGGATVRAQPREGPAPFDPDAT